MASSKRPAIQVEAPTPTREESPSPFKDQSTQTFSRGKVPTITIVPAGRGGTFTVGGVQESRTRERLVREGNELRLINAENDLLTDAIGVHPCITSIAVYFRIKPTRCFVAHIARAVSGSNEIGTLASEGTRFLADAITLKLRQEARTEGWSADQVDQSSVLIVNATSSASAEAARQGVSHFLDAEVELHEGGGFVVDHSKLDGYNLMCGEVITGYERHEDQSLGHDKWRYACETGWLPR